MKEYIFEFFYQFNDPVWDDYIYRETTGNLLSPPLYFSERDCFIAVLVNENILTKKEEGYTITTTDLEKILLSSGIYVKFIDGESNE